MKRLELILVAAMAVSLAGCKLMAKKPAPAYTPAAPVPAEQPLSVPQTQVVLPPEQPVNPEALATAMPVPEKPPAPPPAAPADTTANRGAGRGGTPRVTVPLPAPATPAKPEAPPPAETPRPQVQEILPADQQQQLMKSAQEEIRQARILVAQARKRHLSPQENDAITQIERYIRISEEASHNGDVRTGENLAAKALSLSKDLQSGRR